MQEKRFIILAIIIFLALFLLLARAFELQVINGKEIRMELDAKTRHLFILRPLRGRILDRNGKILATNERFFDLYVIPDEFEKNADVYPALAKLLNKEEDEIRKEFLTIKSRIEGNLSDTPERLKDRALKRLLKEPVLFFKDIQFDSALNIELNPSTYKGLFVREMMRRKYLHSQIATHVIGYVSRVNKKEMADFVDDDLRDLLGDHGIDILKKSGSFNEEETGRTGIENFYNQSLQGSLGLAILERDSEKGSKNQVELKEPHSGNDIVLTIDLELQSYVAKILNEYKRAAAVVIDAKSSEILCLASNPSYDPNDFVSPVQAKLVNNYLKDENSPMLNRAISGRYQLGSLFKLVTLAAALETGKITSKTTFECKGKFSQRQENLRCWIYRQHGLVHGPLTPIEALERSCNIYFFELGRMLGLAALSEWASKFGFGSRTQIDLPYETEGLIPDTAKTKSSAAILVSIGQGDILATPLQVAQAIAFITGNGECFEPRIVRADPIKRKILLSERTLKIIKQGMSNVVHNPQGTAYASDLKNYSVAGKTSSAQTAPGGNAHAWFGGFAPFDNPRYIVAVIVEHAGSGPDIAAPLAAKIFGYLLK